MTKNLLLTVVFAASGCLMVANGAERVKMAAPAKLPGVPVMEEPIYNPEGTDETYIMNVTENTFWGDENVEGYKMTVRRSADGSKIYFNNLTPGFNGDENTEGYTWVAGTVEGNDITIPAGQVLYKTDMQVLYLEVVTVDELGQVKDFLNDVHFTIDNGKITQTDNSLRISVFDDADTQEEAGFFIFMNNFEMQPISDIATFTPPTDAEVEQWMLTSETGSRFVSVARSGNDVYIAGLSSMAPDDYVPGTIADGKLTIKSGYILTSNSMKYIRLIGAREGAEPDEFGFPQLVMIPTYEFDVNEAGDSFTLNPADDYIVEASYFNFNMLDGISGVKIFRYAGDVAATPAAPEISLWSEDEQVIQFTVPCSDVEGNFINPEHLTYRIYLDGEPHVFTPDAYYYLDAAMTDIPYGFSDNYDIYSNGDVKTIYLHAPEFGSLEIESTYTVNGDARTSSRAQMSGIRNINAEKSAIISESFTDLLGRTVSRPTPGAVLIKTTLRADGTRTSAKFIAR